MDADVIVVGAGLAGLVATNELTTLGKKVAVVDQENSANIGGQAFWSFGGDGAHGYNALEGTFLGGCLFTGRAAGRAAADAQ